MKKILVTGGAGFIGSHVVDRLVDQHKQVLIIDNLSSGKKENVNKSNLVDIYEVDITEATEIEAVFLKNKDIDAVIHLAAQSKVGPSIENPIYDANININGTINVLEFCKKFGVSNFVYASSAAVYGPTEQLPIVEECSTQPLSPYGVSKLAAEEYVKAYGRLYDMNVFALRFANVYGPRQTAATEAGVITIFVEQLLSEIQPTIFGDGEQTRDFVYVDDVANAITSCLLKSNSYTRNSVYNVSTGTEISVNLLLKELCEIVNVSFNPRYETERPGDIRKSYLDNRKLMDDFQWTPKMPLKEGLVNTIKFYQK